MRRKDKQIAGRKEIEDILGKGIVCSIAFSDGNKPYLVTVNYGYREGVIFIHSAMTGRKIDLALKNPHVCFQVVLEKELVKGDDACRDFTMKYRSVVGYGRISIVKDADEKREALSVLMKQHTGRGNFEFRDNSVAETAILKIIIDEITGKKSG